MKIYMTGSTGFVGKHLVEELSSSDITLVKLSRDDLAHIAEYSFEPDSCLIHLAAHVHNMNVENEEEDNKKHYEVNRDLTLRLYKRFQLCSPQGKFIFVSTVHTHGLETKGVFKVSDQCKPQSAYGKSKLEAEVLLEKSFQENLKKGTIYILRLPMVYGPGNKGNIIKFINLASRKIKAPFSAFKQKRSLVYVKNVTFIIKNLIGDKRENIYKKYFITDEKDLSSSEIFNNIYLSINKKNGVYYFPKTIIFIGIVFISWLGKLFNKNIFINMSVYQRLTEEYRFDGLDVMTDLNIKELPYNFNSGIKETINQQKL